jgi:hypothetical protein
METLQSIALKTFDLRKDSKFTKWARNGTFVTITAKRAPDFEVASLDQTHLPDDQLLERLKHSQEQAPETTPDVTMVRLWMDSDRRILHSPTLFKEMLNQMSLDSSALYALSREVHGFVKFQSTPGHPTYFLRTGTYILIWATGAPTHHTNAILISAMSHRSKETILDGMVPFLKSSASILLVGSGLHCLYLPVSTALYSLDTVHSTKFTAYNNIRRAEIKAGYGHAAHTLPAAAAPSWSSPSPPPSSPQVVEDLIECSWVASKATAHLASLSRHVDIIGSLLQHCKARRDDCDDDESCRDLDGLLEVMESYAASAKASLGYLEERAKSLASVVRTRVYFLLAFPSANPSLSRQDLYPLNKRGRTHQPLHRQRHEQGQLVHENNRHHDHDFPSGHLLRRAVCRADAGLEQARGDAGRVLDLLGPDHPGHVGHWHCVARHHTRGSGFQISIAVKRQEQGQDGSWGG